MNVIVMVSSKHLNKKLMLLPILADFRRILNKQNDRQIYLLLLWLRRTIPV